MRRPKKLREGEQIRREELRTHSTLMRQLFQRFPDLQTIEDSHTPIGIPVRPSDIEAAKRGKPDKCAVAMGATRNMPSVTGAFISRHRAVLVFNKTRAVRYRVPISTYGNLFAFDRGGTVEPGVYMLGAVSPKDRLLALQARISTSRRMQGSPRVEKGQPRPAPRKTRTYQRRTHEPISLLLRTWGDPHPATMAEPVIAE
jgi:hypothetical protein